MNWYKESKKKKKEKKWNTLDTQLLCCGYPENKRKDPYKKNAQKKENKILYVARGIPGSGKSTLAKDLGKSGQVFSSDEFFMINGEYKFDPKKLSEAHQWNQTRAKKAMEQGISPIVIDNTNVRFSDFKIYLIFAKQYGYEVKFVQPNWHKDLYTPEGKWNFNFLKGRNVHGVPDEAVKRMIDRFEYNPTEEKILNSK
jgi:adenylate kinase family enzyme